MSANKLSTAEREEIANRYQSGESTVALGREFGVSSSNVRQLLKRRGIDRRDTYRLDAQQKDEMIRCYRAGESFVAIGRKLGVDATTIRYQLVRHGITLRPNPNAPKLSSSQRAEVCQRYVAGESALKLAQVYGMSSAAITDLLKRRGVRLRSISEARRLYTCDHQYFDSICSEAQAYWLGFIGADGCVMDKKNTLAFTLAAKDADHLQRFLDSLGGNHPIRETENSAFGKTYPMVRLAIRSKELVAGLGRHGVSARKSLTHQWPDFLPEQLLSHYLRGYFDGDGCIGICGSQHNFSLLGSETFLIGCRQYLTKQLGLSATKLRQESAIHLLQYGGRRQVASIAKLMYQDATLYLPRKYEKVAHLLEEGGDQVLVDVDADRLAALRQQHGLYAHQLSLKAGLGKEAVARIERGHRAFRNTVLKLAAALDVKPSKLTRSVL